MIYNTPLRHLTTVSETAQTSPAVQFIKMIDWSESPPVRGKEHDITSVNQPVELGHRN